MTEPLGMNPLATLVRYLTPAARTPDEKPFDMVEFRLIKSLFNIDHWEAYDLCVVPAAVLSGATMKKPVNILTKVGDMIDRIIFAVIPPSRYWARQTLFELRKAS